MRGTSRFEFEFFFFFHSLFRQTIMLGSEGAGSFLGLLRFITTLLGRIMSDLYGRWLAKNPPPEEYAFDNFAIMEMGVFFLENGAAILVLENSTGGITIVEMISIWLTMICGVCYIGYLVFTAGKIMLKDGLNWEGGLSFRFTF